MPLPTLAADCWFLAGPTASGKTELGLELAQRLGAEIVSLDSMALYREMDIGTAKPSLEVRRRVPHHLIDILDPSEEFSLSQYVEAAEEAVREIRSRGLAVLFVGGTPLYLKSLLRGIFEGPPADWALRSRLEAEAAAEGPGFLHERLAQIDPAAADRLHPRDTRRIIRALEVHEKTGRPISELQGQFDTARTADECRVFVLDRPREELYERINDRVEQMFSAGFVDEVRRLSARPLPLGRTASQAVGYREVLEHLTGTEDLAAAGEAMKTRTRRFARRQLTWFRSLSECRTIPADPTIEQAELALRMIDQASDQV